MATAAKPYLHIASDKLLEPAELHTTRRACAEAGQTFVFTNGCFDLLHRGHVELLWEAASRGDVLMVGVNSDASVHALKGTGRPLVPEGDRAWLLASLKPVSYVCLFDEPSVESLVSELLPDLLVKGGDYEVDEIVGARAVLATGGRVETLSYYKNASTSALIEQIREAPD